MLLQPQVGFACAGSYCESNAQSSGASLGCVITTYHVDRNEGLTKLQKIQFLCFYIHKSCARCFAEVIQSYVESHFLRLYFHKAVIACKIYKSFVL